VTGAPVLAAVDPDSLDLSPAWFGATVAAHMEAPLLVASVYASDDAIDRLAGGQLGEDLPRDATDALDRALELLRDDDVVAEQLLLAATSVPRGLELAAAQAGAGLLVVGSAPHGSERQPSPGGTAIRLLNGAGCAVEVVPRSWDRSYGVRTVAIAYVEGDEGRAALHDAHALADRAGARLRVVSAVCPRAWMDDGDDLEADLRLRAEQAGHAAVSGLLGEPVDVDVEVREPSDYLLDVAAEVDLLICGSRGYGPTGATMLGGVTRRVTAEAACPVIVTPRGQAPGLRALLE
jgi:nucleotide-binding universal stress UspA family protein